MGQYAFTQEGCGAPEGSRCRPRAAATSDDVTDTRARLRCCPGPCSPERTYGPSSQKKKKANAPWHWLLTRRGAAALLPRGCRPTIPGDGGFGGSGASAAPEAAAEGIELPTGRHHRAGAGPIVTPPAAAVPRRRAAADEEWQPAPEPKRSRQSEASEWGRRMYVMSIINGGGRGGGSGSGSGSDGGRAPRRKRARRPDEWEPAPKPKLKSARERREDAEGRAYVRRLMGLSDDDDSGSGGSFWSGSLCGSGGRWAPEPEPEVEPESRPPPKRKARRAAGSDDEDWEPRRRALAKRRKGAA